MKIVIEIPDSEVPSKQEMLSVDLHFIDGHVCECIYPFEELKAELCEDCISCEAVAEILNHQRFGMSKMSWDIISEKLSELPPVQPKQRTGHWEYVQYDGNPNIGNWHCSECNRIVCGAITAVNPVYSYKYCPDCGAKMQEVEE